jgi:predicted nucleic acid-binding Zn ribbon protein
VSAKLPLLILLVGFLNLIGFLDAQVATDPELQSRGPRETPLPTPTAEPTVPERAQIDEIFKQTSLGKEADERRLHIEWRSLQNRVVNEPDIVAAKRATETARTDLEKRQRLRDYYDLYYGRLRVLARSAEMKTALDQLKIAHVSQVTQARVRHETDSALPTPSPTPKKKKKASRAKKFQGEG